MDENLNNITLQKGTNQKGKIKVHSEIINTLSSGIYNSPANCVKELINNSFDADASLVTIRIKPLHDTITIIDDGHGMNALDFDQNFAWISKSNKRNNSENSPHGRPLIGKIGIGFIAVNEICDELEVISSKKDEPFKFTARINFKSYLEKDTQENEGIIKGEFSLINEDEEKNEHYTIINLIGLKETVMSILSDRQYYSTIIKEENKDFDVCKFKNMEQLMLHHYTKKLKSLEKDNAYIQFIIDLAAYIPVEYIQGGPIVGFKNPVINQIVEMHKKFKFKVDMDGVYLKKPIYFPKDNPARKDNKQIIKTFNETIKISADKSLSFFGYFYSWNELLVPREFNGVAIRIKNIPIAERFGFDTTFLGYPSYTDQLFRNWITGEIYVQEGLEDAMSIDRRSFRKTHLEYIALQNWVHEFLRKELFAKLIQGLYDEGREKREKVKELKAKLVQKQILGNKKVIIKTNPTIKNIDKKFTEDDYAKPPLTISSNDNSKIIIKIDESIRKKYTSEDWKIVENVFIIFEMVLKESKGDLNKLRELFYLKMSELNELKRGKK